MPLLQGLLTENFRITKVKDPTTAGTSDVTSDSVDMAADGGWDNVAFLTSYGTAAANNLMHAESSSDDGDADTFADIAGSELDLAGASDEDQIIDIAHPPERYVRVVAQCGTSTTVGDIWAIQYNGKKLPISPDITGTIQVQQLVAPATGTK